MALGGFLGGLANLGTIYGGYQQAQARDQYLQQQLQQQQALQNLVPFYANNPQLFPTGQQQPKPGTATPGTTPTPGPLQPTTTAPAQTQPPTPLLPQVPSATAQMNEPIPGLGALGGGTGGGPAAGSPFGPSQPVTGPMPGLIGSPSGPSAPFGNLASGLLPPQPSLEGFGGTASRGLPQSLPLAQWPDTTAPQETADRSMRGPAAGEDVYIGTTSFGAPTLNGLGIGGAGQTPWQRYAQSTPQGPLSPAGASDFAALRQPLWRPETPLTPPQAPAADGDTVSGTTQPVWTGSRFEQRQRPPAPQAADAETADTGGPVATRVSEILRQRGWSDAAIKGALANGMAESGLKPWGETGAAGEQGIWQMNPSGELPGFQKLYGNSRSVEDQTNYMANRVEQSMPGYTRLTSATQATDAFMSGFEKPARGVPGSRYQFLGQTDREDAFTGAHREMSNDLSREQHGIGDRGLQMLLARMPPLPQAIPYMNPSQVAQLLQQQFPGTSDAVKGAMFLKIMPMMNDYAKEQTAQAWEGWKAQMEQLGFIQKEEDIAEQRAERRSEFGIRMAETEAYHEATAGKGGQVWQDPQSGQSYWVVGGRVQPLEGLPSTAVKPSAAKQGYQILTDPNTGTQYQQVPGRPETAIDMQGNPYKPTGAARLGTVGPGQARWSEDAMNSLVQQALSGDSSVMQRLPRSGPARQQFEESLAARMKELEGGIEGNTATMMMNRVRMLEAQSAARTAGRVTMNTELFSQEAQLAGKNLIEVSKEVPRSAIRPLNELLLAFETNTGDPEVIKLGTAVNAVINAYGKMSNPTGTGIHDTDKARISAILDRSLSQGQIEAGVKQIITEGKLVSQAAQKAQEEVLGRITPRAPGTEPPEKKPPKEETTTDTGGGGTPDTAIATMNKQQVIDRLNADPPPDEDTRFQLNQRLNQLEAATRAAPPSTGVPPTAR